LVRQAVVGRPAETDRAWLVTGALAFVRNVIGHPRKTPLPGILHVAALGAILNNKPNPKDIDLLVAVAKVYTIDTGLARAVGYASSPNTGHLLENAVYLALRRRTAELFYWAAPNSQEVDFYLPEEKQLIQVAASVDQPATLERELRAMNEAMQAMGIKHGLLLTSANALPTTVRAGTVETRSVAEWLLSPE
jgi:predicted AAA+ superfamily ATPase